MSEFELQQLQFLLDELRRLSRTTGTLISWMAQSVNSPISREEAKQLLEMLKPGEFPGGLK